MKLKNVKWFFVFFLLALMIPMSVYSETLKHLTVYSGMMMVEPMEELGREFEKANGCKIRIIKAGSGKLLTMLLQKKNADLFLPGSEGYIKRIEKEHPGLITSQAHVGYNQAAIFVKKGNPKTIPANLDALSNEKYKVVIGSPDNGSIGKVTKAILTKHGSYDSVRAKATVTDHAIGLVRAIKMGKADISINWLAASTWDENKEQVEAFKISETYVQKKKLILTVLSDSKVPDLAKAFFIHVSSDHGKSVFKKYGLGE